MPEGFPFEDIFEGLPELGFFATLGRRFQQRDPRYRYFSRQFNPIYDEYKGQLGQDLFQGRLPTLRFGQFLQDYPFTRTYGALPPSFRGIDNSRFAPPTRFLY